MEFVYYLIAFVCGVCIGGQLNHAIYRFAFSPRLISPWSQRAEGASAPKAVDRVPVYGWFGLARDASVHGKGFWIRPMLIELGVGLAFAWLLKFIVFDRGLLDSSVVGTASVTALTTYIWYGWYVLLFAAMVVATFIDFDEKTIPDEVTVPVTLIGLLLSALYPAYRLPITINTPNGLDVGSLHIGSPNPIPKWIDAEYSIWIGLACFLGWCFAIFPFIWTMRFGISGYFRIALASIFRPRRRTESNLPRKPRRSMDPHIVVLFLIALIGSIGINWCWMFRQDHPVAWESLMCALIGLAFSGGIVWAIRIIGFLALQREAMGFGDVTLMAMIGVFLGWQSALLIFIFAAIIALAVIILISLFVRESEIPYGPYLCAGCLVVMIGWSGIWNQWAGPTVFSVAFLLLPVLGIAFVLMGPLLLIVNLIKTKVLGYTDE